MTTNAAAQELIDQLVSAYNAHSTEILSELYQPDVSYWSVLSGTSHGRQAVIESIERLHVELPDEQMRVKTVIADDDVIVVEFQSTGTDSDGRPYVLDFTEVFQVVDGKVASIKVYIDPDEVAAISR